MVSHAGCGTWIKRIVKFGNHHHHTFGEGRGLQLGGSCGIKGFSIMPSHVNHERRFHYEASTRVTCIHFGCTSQPHKIFIKRF